MEQKKKKMKQNLKSNHKTQKAKTTQTHKTQTHTKKQFSYCKSAKTAKQNNHIKATELKKYIYIINEK